MDISIAGWDHWRGAPTEAPAETRTPAETPAEVMLLDEETPARTVANEQRKKRKRKRKQRVSFI